MSYFPETCRENMIFLCSATWACISCLQIVICWQGLCHDTTHLSLPSPAGELQLFFLSDGLKSAATSTLSPSAFTSSAASSWTWLRNAHISVDTKVRPWTVNIPRLINSPARLFLLSCRLLSFVVLPAFSRDACLWDETWGKWNVVIEEKVQIGSSCKWSLVSGGRFLFTR